MHICVTLTLCTLCHPIVCHPMACVNLCMSLGAGDKTCNQGGIITDEAWSSGDSETGLRKDRRGSVVIFTILILPIQECGISLHLFMSSLISFISI